MVDVEKHGGFFTDFWSTDAFDRNNSLKRTELLQDLAKLQLL